MIFFFVHDLAFLCNLLQRMLSSLNFYILNGFQCELLLKLRLDLFPINANNINRHIPSFNTHCLFCNSPVEDLLHVLLSCPHYESYREILCQQFFSMGVQNVDLKILCGEISSLNLSFDEQKKIFLGEFLRQCYLKLIMKD